MVRPVLVDKRSPFLGEDCALCKQPFAPGDEIVICPEDASRHHVHCWRANNNHCTAYGCEGQGEVVSRRPRAHSRHRGRLLARPVESAPSPRSKVRTMPSSSFGCAQSCLVIGIAVTIVLFAVGCFGLWAIADYIMMEVLGWQYRAPLGGVSLPAALFGGLQSLSLLWAGLWL